MILINYHRFSIEQKIQQFIMKKLNFSRKNRLILNICSQYLDATDPKSA